MLVKKCYHLLLEKDVILHLNQLESPSPKDALCQVWLKLTHWFWRRRFSKFVNVFSLFRNYFPFEKAGFFIWINLNSCDPRMLCAKFSGNWPTGSGEEEENVKSLQRWRRRWQRRWTMDKFVRWANNYIISFTSHISFIYSSDPYKWIVYNSCMFPHRGPRIHSKINEGMQHKHSIQFSSGLK